MIIAINVHTGIKELQSKAVSVFATFVLALLAGIFVPPLYADIYSWTDSNGVKRFSNVPPPPDTYSIVEVNREFTRS